MKNHGSKADCILTLDAGDFLRGQSKLDSLSTEYLLRGMSLLNYDVVNIGEKDLQLGKEFLITMRDKYNIPFVSANVVDVESGMPIFKPYIIKRLKSTKVFGFKFGGLRVGIFGVTIPDHRIDSEKGKILDLHVKDPIPVAQEMVAELRDKCDILIALCHLGTYGSKSLAQKVAGIDVIISGHGANIQNKPLKIGQTLVVQPGNNGKYIGDLELILDGNYSIISHKGLVTPLSDEIPDDNALVELIKLYKSALQEMSSTSLR